MPPPHPEVCALNSAYYIIPLLKHRLNLFPLAYQASACVCVLLSLAPNEGCECVASATSVDICLISAAVYENSGNGEPLLMMWLAME